MGHDALNGLEETQPRLLFPVSPLPGEGVKELIVRAAAANGYRTVAWLSSLIDEDPNASIKKINRSPAVLRRIEMLLGCKIGILDALTHAPIGGEPEWVNFFGVNVKRRNLLVGFRRVSPLGLRASPHLRGIWSLQPLSFDPVTRETLIDRCPSCARRFCFHIVDQPWSCAFCMEVDHEGFERSTVDLRDFPQPLVGVDDEDALDFVMSLVDPCFGERRSCDWPLHDDLKALSKGELFELALSLSRADFCYKNHGDKTRTSRMGRYHPDATNPYSLAIAGRVLLGWPKTFHVFAEAVRSVPSGRASIIGHERELGALSIVTREQSLPAVRSVLRKAMLDNKVLIPREREDQLPDEYLSADLIDQSEAARILGCARYSVDEHLKSLRINADLTRGKKRLIRYRASDIAAVKEDAKLWVSFRVTEDRLGISYSDLIALANHGLLRTGLHPLRKPQKTFDFDVNSVDGLCENLLQRAKKPPNQVDGYTLGSIVGRMTERSEGVWFDLAEAILSGRLEVWRGSEAGLLGCLRVHSSLAVTKALRLGGRDIALLAGEIREEFDWTPHDLGALNKQRLVSFPYFERDLREVKSKYIFPKELRALLKSKGFLFSARALIEHLRSLGLEPSPKTWQTVWKRTDLARVLREMDLQIA